MLAPYLLCAARPSLNNGSAVSGSGSQLTGSRVDAPIIALQPNSSLHLSTALFSRSCAEGPWTCPNLHDTLLVRSRGCRVWTRYGREIRQALEQKY